MWWPQRQTASQVWTTQWQSEKLPEARFYTAINLESPIEPKKSKQSTRLAQRYHTLETTDAGPRIVEHHAGLKSLALTLDERMHALLREHEKDFFLAYKTHMYHVQGKIRELELKAEQEEAKTREDSKIKDLERELDWFKTEALRLDELCKGYKREVDKWRAKAEALDEDRRFLEDQSKGSKRQNKILRAAAERARSSAYSAMMMTKQRARAEDQSCPENGDASVQPTGDVRSRPSSSGVSRGRTLALAVRQGHAAALVPTGSSMPSVSSEMLPDGGGSEERYLDAIKHLRESLTREQHTVRMLQAARSYTHCKKSEMEELFLKCVDEARRVFLTKKHLRKPVSDKQQMFNAIVGNEDVLVSLYERLFPHRTGIARSPGVGVACCDR